MRQGPKAWSWRNWDAPYRDPDSPEVAAFAAEHEDAVAYQIFLQWLTARSYGDAQRACREAGMKVGLIADLAIGMDGTSWDRATSQRLMGLWTLPLWGAQQSGQQR